MCFMYIIETSINKGLKTFHFLWGETEYKRRLLAKPHSLYFYSVYRSYSINYFLDKTKSILENKLRHFEQSEFTRPIRNLIKSIRNHPILQALKPIVFCGFIIQTKTMTTTLVNMQFCFHVMFY